MPEITNESNNKKARLGRGLGSLLGQAQGGNLEQANGPAQNPEQAKAEPSKTVLSEKHSSNEGTKVWNLPIEKLQASQFQPRTHFEKDKLEELANSIKTQGILQPIVARKLGDSQFEIIAGERRWRAAQLAGLHEVPVIIKTLSNKETLELALIENIQREDLNPIEEAEAYQRLAEEFQLTQQQVSERVGKERATVANALRLLALPRDVRELLAQGLISTGHAKVLLSLNDYEQMSKAAKKVVDEQLSVRHLERVVHAYKNLQGGAKSSSTAQDLSQLHSKSLAEELQKLWGRKIQIDYLNGKGKITVSFYSDAELNDIADRMREACKN